MLSSLNRHLEIGSWENHGSILGKNMTFKKKRKEYFLHSNQPWFSQEPISKCLLRLESIYENPFIGLEWASDPWKFFIYSFTSVTNLTWTFQQLIHMGVPQYLFIPLVQTAYFLSKWTRDHCNIFIVRKKTFFFTFCGYVYLENLSQRRRFPPIV